MRIKKTYPVILILALILGFGCIAHAGELINPTLGASYVKLSDGTKNIWLSLSARVDDKRVQLDNASITVFAVNESKKTLLGTTGTDYKGRGMLSIKSDKSIPKDKDGYFTFDVQYYGDSKFSKASKIIRVKDVSLSMTFIEKDSTKTVRVKAYELNSAGVKVDVKGIPVEFYIKRLFCLYRFGGEKTDSSGYCVAQFPKNIPGDTLGNVIVFTKILENEDYGTVETVQTFTGGKPLFIEPKPKRGLGDTDAPLWMVYTLIVLLSGVWFHVFYVLSCIIRINLIGKRALSQAGK